MHFFYFFLVHVLGNWILLMSTKIDIMVSINLSQAYELCNSGKGMEFMDPSLDDTLSTCKLIRCMQIALLCVQGNAADRPSMLEVSSMLKSESDALPIPKVPTFSKKTNEDEENKSELWLEICSINDTTMSQFVAR
jgi:hypothetical protein